MSTKNRNTTRRPGLFRRAVNAGRAAMQTFAEPESVTIPRQQLLREMGIPGDQLDDAGLVPDAWNPNLSGREWVSKVDEMRDLCGPVQAVECGITLPIADTEWTVDSGGSDEIREWVEYALFEAPSTPWPDVVRRAALSAIYGTWVMEKVWKEEDGKLIPRRFADRLPRSIVGYEFDAEQSLSGVKQRGVNTEGDEIEITLPAEKLLLFPYRLEGADWHGRSCLRFAYKHYEAQKFLSQFSLIGAEKGTSGLPYMQSAANATDVDNAKALAAVKAIRRHESGGLVVPFGYELKQLQSMSPEALYELIRTERSEIARGCLLDFIYLGDDGTGSLALSDRKIRFASMAWNYLASSIAAVINRHLVRQLMLLNFPSAAPADFPRVTPSTVGLAMILDAMSDFLKTTIDGKLVLPDVEGRDENFFRSLLGLPIRSEEELAATRAATSRTEAVGPSGVGAPLAAPRATTTAADGAPLAAPRATTTAADGAPLAAPRATTTAADGAQQAAPLQTMTEPSARTMTFAAVDVDRAVARVAGDMAAAEDAWQRQGRVHLIGWLESLLSQLDALQGDVTRAGEVAVPAGLVDAYGDWLGEWLLAAWDTAAQTMVETLTPALSQGEMGIPAAPAERLRARARMIAAHHAEAARFEVVMAALRGETGEAIGAKFAEAMSSRLRGELPEAGREIAEALSRP